MQYNVKSAKGFRDILAKWHNADFELALAIIKKSENIKNLKGMIDTDNEMIERIDSGDKSVMKTRDELVAEVTDFETRIAHESATVTELRKVQSERLADAYALLTKDLHKAYVDFIKNGNRDGYVDALAQFFTDNGLTPTTDGIDTFIACVGKKKATTRTKVADAKHNDAFAYTAWRDIFLGEICDVMGDALPIDKNIYKTMEERKKAWEDKKKK